MIVYIIKAADVSSLPYETLNALMPERCSKAEKFLREGDKLMSLGAGLLIHALLGISERSLQYTSFGKPYTESGVHFNVSHSGGYSMLAYDSSPVGADIEQIKEYDNKLVPFIFSETEQQWINNSPQKRFYYLWSIKESIMKAVGSGMNLEPLSVKTDPERSELILNDRQWYYRYTEWNGCSIAVASAKPFDDITIKLLSPSELKVLI